MKLRLLVRRLGFSDAAIVWPIDISQNPTVSQLLEQVNEVIPLESGGEWGLEDYVVEIRGEEARYECLHFQFVKDVLNQDDEVL